MSLEPFHLVSEVAPDRWHLLSGGWLPNRLHVRGAISAEGCIRGDSKCRELYTVPSWYRRSAQYHRMVSHRRSDTHHRRHPVGRDRRTWEGEGGGNAAGPTHAPGPNATDWTVLQVLRRRHERQYHLLSQLRKIPVLTEYVIVSLFKTESTRPSSSLPMSPWRVSQQPDPLRAASAACCSASGWQGRRAPPSQSRRVSAV